MSSIKQRQALAVLLLVAAVAALVWAMVQSDRATDIQGPAALVTTPAGEVWVGVDDRLWRLGPDGDLRHDDTLAALGLPGAPSNLHRHPNGGIVASVRDQATLFVLDPATARVRGRIQPQWPADLARHGARAINLALHADGRIAIATGGGHAVALFDADGRFIARSAPDLYRFTNGLWWVGDTLWTTDTNRSQLKRLDGRTLALQQTVTLDAAQAARYLGPARLHPTAAERVALIRFHNGMTRGRMAVLDGSSERPLPQATVIEPIDVDWFNDDVVVTDGASHQLLRVDGTSGLARPWADGRARQKLAQGLMQRDRLLLHWKLGLVAAAGLFMVALALAWHAQQLQQQSDDQARPIDLSYLGTPRLTRGQRAPLTSRLLAPWLLFVVPPIGLQVFDVRGWLGLDRGQWVWVLSALLPLLVAAAVLLQRRQSRLSLDPAFEPVLNAQALSRLERGQGLRDALRPDETVLETAMWLCPTLRWVVLTDLRLLCFVAGLGRPRLEWAHPRAALRDVAWLPRSPQRWSRWVGAGAGGPGWLQLRLPDGRLVQGRVTAPTVGQRLVAELTDARERPRSAALPVVPAPRDGSGPGPWRAAVLSLLLPGLGQWLQRRAGAALLLFLPWAVLVTFVAVPTLVTAWTPRADVPGWRVAQLLGAWAVLSLSAAFDAWRLAPRR